MAGGTPAEIDADGFRVAASGKTNIIAETAVARGDIRTLSAEQETRIRARMQEIVAQHLPQTEAELVFAERTAIRRWRRPRATERCWPGSTRSTGTSACPRCPNMTRPGAARPIWSFVAGDTDVLAGLGAAGGGAHAEGEYVELDSLGARAARRHPDDRAGRASRARRADQARLAVTR